MSYVSKVLQPGEVVVYSTGLHWLVYRTAILLLCVAIALGIGALYVSPEMQLVLLIAAGIFAVLALLAGAIAAIRRASTELAVTDQRVIYKRGIFGRHTIEMNRSKVESVDVDQSIIGRILGYGTVVLRGTGGSLDPLPNISDPLTFRSQITTK
jgi:uncharacterized membrane protein YdbT with pleckstrin-like domain